MREYVDKFSVLVLLFIVAFVNSEVTLENGGYSVLVSFSQNVPSQNGQVLLEKIKESLKNANEVLHKAIGLHFSKVTFKLPDSWDTSAWGITTVDAFNFNSSRGDFLIDSKNDTVFGKFPFAQQYGGCGIPGRQIIIPSAFFDEANTYPKGISIAREWLKYRYGVFDENGYFKDPLYPLYTPGPGNDLDDVKITDCTNEEVTYDFLDKDNKECSDSSDKSVFQRLQSKECKIKANTTVTSSLMYFQEDITTVQHICGKDEAHPHNSKSPNKHNALCEGQSIWDVVKKSPDFKDGSQENATIEELGDIQYDYIQESKPKIVVAWENTLLLKKKSTVILSAILNFLNDLPVGSKFNGFHFKSDVLAPNAADYTFHELKSLGEKKTIVGSITSTFAANETGDINLVIRKALEIISNAKEIEGTIIIITGSSGKLDNGLKEQLKNSEVCVKLMYLTESKAPEDLHAFASDLPCGTLEEFSMTDRDNNTFKNLLNAMERTLPSSVGDTGKETVKVEYLSKDSPISVEVDEYVENVIFSVFSRPDNDAFILNFNSADTEITSIDVFGDARIISYSPKETGKAELIFKHEGEKMLTHVTTTSKRGTYFDGEVFFQDTSENSTVQMPVIIYAFIRFGAYPVQNANVSATIRTPNGVGETLTLLDEGRGDPDITRNDGIYSRYFTKFSEKGEYTVTVSVNNIAGDTTYGVTGDAGYETCCGSIVNHNTSKLKEFYKEFKSSFTAVSGRPDNGYKPLRIRDLQSRLVNDDKITLKWTAPGGEADNDEAALKYEIKLLCGEEKITECNSHEKIQVLDKPAPLSYGNEQKVNIQILTNAEVLSVGIVTVSQDNISSDLSNIVEIFRPMDIPVENTTEKPNTPPQAASPTGTIIGITIAVILVIACIVSGIIYFLKRRSKNKRQETHEFEENANKRTQDINPDFRAADYPIYSVPVKKTESFPVFLYTHNQIKDYKDKGNEPPLYQPKVPPKMWSSLGAIGNARAEEDERDIKSLGSSSTVHVTEGSDNNTLNGVESQNR